MGKAICFCTQVRHTIEWMLKAARTDQKAKRQLNLELWNVPHTVQTPMGQTLQNGGILIFLKNIFQKKGKVESLT